VTEENERSKYVVTKDINRPSERGKKKSLSDKHCQCEKEMEGRLLACLQFLKKSHVVKSQTKERAPFLKINDINGISFLERLTAIIVGL
jgi:hypothetical protein